MKNEKWSKGDTVLFEVPLMQPLEFKIESFMTMSGNQKMLCGEYGCFPINSKALTKIKKRK